MNRTVALTDQSYPKARKCIQQAIEKHALFAAGLRAIKVHALASGFALVDAKRLVPDGEWLTFLNTFRDKKGNALMPQKTAWRYMDFASRMIEWTRQELAKKQRKIERQESRLRRLAMEIMMQSPKEFVGICRRTDELIEQGEYDPEAYKKLPEAHQLEFPQLDFADFTHHVSRIRQSLSDPACKLLIPDGKTLSQTLSETRAELRAADEAIAARLEALNENES